MGLAILTAYGTDHKLKTLRTTVYTHDFYARIAE